MFANMKSCQTRIPSSSQARRRRRSRTPSCRRRAACSCPRRAPARAPRDTRLAVPPSVDDVERRPAGAAAEHRHAVDAEREAVAVAASSSTVRKPDRAQVDARRRRPSESQRHSSGVAAAARRACAATRARRRESARSAGDHASRPRRRHRGVRCASPTVSDRGLRPALAVRPDRQRTVDHAARALHPSRGGRRRSSGDRGARLEHAPAATAPRRGRAATSPACARAAWCGPSAAAGARPAACASAAAAVAPRAPRPARGSGSPGRCSSAGRARTSTSWREEHVLEAQDVGAVEPDVERGSPAPRSLRTTGRRAVDRWHLELASEPPVELVEPAVRARRPASGGSEGCGDRSGHGGGHPGEVGRVEVLRMLDVAWWAQRRASSPVRGHVRWPVTSRMRASLRPRLTATRVSRVAPAAKVLRGRWPRPIPSCPAQARGRSGCGSRRPRDLELERLRTGRERVQLKRSASRGRRRLRLEPAQERRRRARRPRRTAGVGERVAVEAQRDPARRSQSQVLGETRPVAATPGFADGMRSDVPPERGSCDLGELRSAERCGVRASAISTYGGEARRVAAPRGRSASKSSPVEVVVAARCGSSGAGGARCRSPRRRSSSWCGRFRS